MSRMTSDALALCISTGFRNGPWACSANGDPSVQPVARPSQNMPPIQRPSAASKYMTGLQAV